MDNIRSYGFRHFLIDGSCCSLNQQFHPSSLTLGCSFSSQIVVSRRLYLYLKMVHQFVGTAYRLVWFFSINSAWVNRTTYDWNQKNSEGVKREHSGILILRFLPGGELTGV
jgi:hypothetical protein